MDLIKHYNDTIIKGFDKYHIPDLNLETAKIVFFLESGHKDEVRYQKPLCGESGKNFSKELFEQEIAFGLWDNKPKTVGILESSPFPLQKGAYLECYKEDEYPINRQNSTILDRFVEFRTIVYDIDSEKRKNLINQVEYLPVDIIKTELYKDYVTRVDNVVMKIDTIMLCGLFAQRFFNSYLFEKFILIKGIDTYGKKSNTGTIQIDDKQIRLIYINHPEEWYDEHNNYSYLKSTIQIIKEIISDFQ